VNLDFGADRDVTLVCGQSGSGKTTFALRYLVNAPDLVARFAWDVDGQISSRLGVPAAVDPEELEASLADGWTVFDPHAMFPGRLAEGFAWFCGWVFEACGRGPGRKVLLVDEVWRYCSPTAIPPTLAECVQTGRVRGLSSMFATQRPNRINESITNETTELVCFRLQGANALRVVQELGAPAEVASLPPGAWIARDLRLGGSLRGALW
jgi:hypothetical protein